MPGEKGKKGEPAPMGPPGVGFYGAKGEEGPCGFLGPPGVPGLKGGSPLPRIMGPQGYLGLPGPPGFMGVRGERGLPRLMDPPGASRRPASANLGNAATEYHNFSEDNVLEICMSLVKNYINEISNTSVGLPGRPGLSGNLGQKRGRIFNLIRH